MDRPIAKIDLIAYADGELSPARCAQVEVYLDQHPALRTEIESIRRLKRAARVALLEAPDAPAVSEELMARVTEILSSPIDQEEAAPTAIAPSKPVTAVPVGSWRRYAVAASLGIVLISAGAIYFYTRDSRDPGELIRPISERPSSNDASVLAVAAVRKHLTCAQLADHFYDSRFPRVIAELPAAGAKYLGADVPIVDLTSMGFDFDGAGGCTIPGGKTLHLLYRSRDSRPRYISLFVQPFAQQVTFEQSKLMVLAGPDGHQVLAWRSAKLVFFLVAGNAADANEAARAYGKQRTDS